MRAGEPRSTSVKKHRWQFHDHLLEIFHMGSTFKTSFMCCLHSRQSVLVTRLQETSSKALSQDWSTQRQSLSQVRSRDIFFVISDVSSHGGVFTNARLGHSSQSRLFSLWSRPSPTGPFSLSVSPCHQIKLNQALNLSVSYLIFFQTFLYLCFQLRSIY